MRVKHDPGGALVFLCQGHRCAALHRLADGNAAATALSTAVATSRGAVLVTTDCLKQCALGALAGIARRDGSTGSVSATVWLSGIQERGRADALGRWIAADGPRVDPMQELPARLSPAVAGYGPPPALRPA